MRIQSPAVVVNDGSREGADRLDEVVAALADHGIEPAFAESCEGADLPATLKRASQAHPDCLIACGGDGTIAAGAEEAMRLGLPLGVVALGTGNSFARKVGLSPGVESGVSAVASGEVISVDVGRAGEVLFLDLFSVGASAEVVRHVTPELKRKWGRLAYLVAGAEALSDLESFRLKVVAEGETIEVESLFVACGPGPTHGGVARLHPDAERNDGRLYGYALDAESKGVLAQLVAGLAVGDPGSMPGIHAFSGTHIEVSTTPSLPTNLDGETRDPTPTVLRVEAGALKVFAPG
ncbi:MAG: hypothetical protein M9921_09505 [Fimbriimonadaceae bacterium]|nr:hypothetical protein [Chthonomonadaceae bacterium]MCO5297079.1 hypothetical protein [Fimbriimonadaceae bacterium]